MVGFLIKKAFFDMWDNLFRIIILNLGYIAVIAIAVFLPYLTSILIGPIESQTLNIVLFAVFLFISIAVVCVYTGAVSCIVKDISDYEEPGFKTFFQYLTETYRASLFFALINSALVMLLTLTMNFYFNMASMIGFVAFAFLFWVGFIWLVSFQFFFPLQSRMDKKVLKNVRKMFMLFFDNTFFALGLLIGSVIILVLSALTALMLPGFGCLVLWWNVALKLRLYKYDYLEEHPEKEKGKKIPWSALLIADKERVGKRTLRGMFFPWKD